MLYLDFEAQGRGSTFTLCHGHLKKAILLHKMARVQFNLNTTVYPWNIPMMMYFSHEVQILTPSTVSQEIIGMKTHSGLIFGSPDKISVSK